MFIICYFNWIIYNHYITYGWLLTVRIKCKTGFNGEKTCQHFFTCHVVRIPPTWSTTRYRSRSCNKYFNFLFRIVNTSTLIESIFTTPFRIPLNHASFGMVSCINFHVWKSNILHHQVHRIKSVYFVVCITFQQKYSSKLRVKKSTEKPVISFYS